MGLMTELFVAEDRDAKGYDPESAEGFERAELGGLTNLEFETLWSILEGEDWDPKKHGLKEVAARPESWIFRFPPSYVDRLQQLRDSDLAVAAAAWAATEEISTTPAEVAPIIGQLVALARSAAKKRQGLYVWTSL